MVLADFMTTLLIEHGTGTKFTQIPFTGGAQALQATLAGTTDVMVGTSLYAMAQKGKLRPLAIATDQRDPKLPEVPTFKELGYNLVANLWFSISAPAGLPKDIAEKVNREINRTVQLPEVQKHLQRDGLVADPMSVEEFNKFIDAETATWKPAMESAGLLTKK